MMRLQCPYCGPRDETEFTFGGEANIARPALDSTDSAWVHYLFYRSNPRGLHHEQWFHAAGCRRWFPIVRDTVTHEINDRPGPQA